MFAGSVASMTVLGAPDNITITLTEFADQARRINRAAALPLLVDADHGYGNALNVMRTVEELETAGVAALSIEDTLLPRPFGAEGQRALISVEEGVGKIKAAVKARSDPDLVIAGRTSAAGVTNIEDAIRRAQAYESAGADAMFLVGVRTRDDLDTIAGEVSLPLILGGVPTSMMDLAYLGSRSVRVCLQGHQPFAAAVEAVYRTLDALRRGTLPADIENVATKELMAQVTGKEDFEGWMRDFL